MTNWWKVSTIILAIILLAIGLFSYYIYHDIKVDEEKMNICYYDICADSVDAWYNENICYCYQNSVLGELVVSKTEYMK